MSMHLRSRACSPPVGRSLYRRGRLKTESSAASGPCRGFRAISSNSALHLGASPEPPTLAICSRLCRSPAAIAREPGLRAVPPGQRTQRRGVPSPPQAAAAKAPATSAMLMQIPIHCRISPAAESCRVMKKAFNAEVLLKSTKLQTVRGASLLRRPSRSTRS